METIDCNASPKPYDLPQQTHNPESLIGLLNVTDLQRVQLVKFGSTKGKTKLNSNVLDYFLGHPNDIPENWDISHGIVFLGTTHYDSENGFLSCRGIGWKDGKKENGLTWFTVPKVVLAVVVGKEHPYLCAVL